MGWIFANLFLLSIPLTAAGGFYLLGSLVTAMHLSEDREGWAFFLAVALSLVITYYVTRWLHRLLDRHVVNRRAP